MKKIFLAVFLLAVMLAVSQSQAAYEDIIFATGNLAPTGTMSEYGGAVPHPALPGASVTNLNKPGTVGNGALSVPMYDQPGCDDNELLIWADKTTDDQQIMRLTFPAPVNLKEIGIIADFGLGVGADRWGKNARFRINATDPNDPSWIDAELLVGDVQDWFDYACATDDFQNVTTIDYRISDFVASDAYSPRIGAVLALTEDDHPCELFQKQFYPMDINQDCYIDLKDLMIIIASWLDCNDPQDPVNCPPALN